MKRLAALTRRSLLRAGALAPLIFPGPALARLGGGAAAVTGGGGGGGGPATSIPGKLFADFQDTADAIGVTNSPTVASGTTFTATIGWSHGSLVVGETITYQWYVDGVPTSPVLQQTSTTADGGFPTLPWVWNTTATPNGTHHLWCKILDSDTRSALTRATGGRPVVIANGGVFNNGDQTIPVGAFSDLRRPGPFPDRIAYKQSTPYPIRTTHPIAYTPILPAFNTGSIYHSNPALLRDVNNWYGEVWSGTRQNLYDTNPEFAAPPQGGIVVDCLNAQIGTSVRLSYEGMVQNNSWDGTRFNTFISPFSTYIEHPAGDGSWLGCEIAGRVFKLSPDGTVDTIVGPRRDKTIPTYYGGSSDQIESIRQTVGTFPPGIDLGGANDLCIDPRDSNIAYCVAPVDNWIGMINLTTKVVTVYAGAPGAADAYVEGTVSTTSPYGTARFAAPGSIIMDGAGTMYISDLENNAIRQLPSSAVGVPGSVTTLCGGTVGPTPPASGSGGATTTYNVTSIVWTNGTGGGSGHVLMADPTTNIKLGFSLSLRGATNTGGDGHDPNSQVGTEVPRYIVTAMTSSRDFTIIQESTFGNVPTATFGTLSGSPMTLMMFNVELVSPPTTATFANTCTVLPLPLRFASPGPGTSGAPGKKIIFGEMGTNTARLIDLTAGTITRITTHEQHLGWQTSGGWMWLDCDYTGACGPVDDIIIAVLEALTHETFSRASFAQAYSPSIGISVFGDTFAADGGPLPQYGPTIDVMQGLGHYPWAISMSRTQPRMVATGTANPFPISMRALQPSDPPFSLDNDKFYFQGRSINECGTVNGFPWDFRPPFRALWGPWGGGWINNDTVSGRNTFEDVNAFYPSTTPGDTQDQLLAAYIQGGMGGTVPRPELTGNYLRDYIYFIRRGTYARSLPPVVLPGPDDPDTTPPVILTMSATRDSATQITVKWTTDKPTIGLACTSTARQIAYPYYPMYSPLESSYTGGVGVLHAMATPCLSNAPPFNNSPVHYTVVVKDMAGNFAYAADQTIT